MKKLTVGVLFGGQSPEHEVSRLSAQAVINNIDKEKYDVTTIGITKSGKWLDYDGDTSLIASGEWEVEAVKKINSSKRAISAENTAELTDVTLEGQLFAEKPDVIFPVLHGCNGEDGTIQGLLELADIPYVGCGVLASAVGMDKLYSKVIFEKAGIPQARYISVLRGDIEDSIIAIEEEIENTFGYPCFVKPSNAGSSVGISGVKEKSILLEALKEASKYDRKTLIEEFIDGQEVECAVLGYKNPMASVVGEIVPCNEFYDFNAKYLDARSETLIPARISKDVEQKVREYAVRACKAIDCAGLSRVDFFVEKNTNRVILNEINTMPGFTNISMYSKLWDKSGIPYSELIDKLILLAIERFEDNKKSYERE